MTCPWLEMGHGKQCMCVEYTTATSFVLASAWTRAATQ